MTSAPGDTSPAKAVARVALLDADEKTAGILRECFRQFGIQTVALGGDAVRRLQREKFEACVLRLHSGAGEVLEAIRNSPSNSRMVIYGIGDSLSQALKFSRYGVNAVLDHPVERQQALKIVRSTYLLVVHELRRYVRVPLLTEVKMEFGGRRLSGSTTEISAGGMSLETSAHLDVPDGVLLSFELPGSRTVVVNANVCWVRGDHSRIGLRFDIQDDRRLAVKDWIEEYLEIA